jgi:hypothetical protein
MNYRLAQIILAARSDDAEGWINTLVIVLLVVFWAIGGILKARAKKTEAEDEGEYGEEPLKPAARPAKAKPVYPPSRIASAEQDKARARGVAVQRPSSPHILLSEDKRGDSRADAKKIEARQAELFVRKRKKAAVAKITGPKKPEEPAVEPLLSAEEPDELKKAILHYEILGKPISLREPMDEGLR